MILKSILRTAVQRKTSKGTYVHLQDEPKADLSTAPWARGEDCWPPHKMTKKLFASLSAHGSAEEFC